MRKVEVCSYNEKWVLMFAEEAEKLKQILGNEIVEIYHIGSTSVQWLMAKPIIDIMPVVYDIHIVDSYNDEMEKIGYKFKGENGIPGRRYFQKGEDNRTHHVHISGWKSWNKSSFSFSGLSAKSSRCKKNYGELKERLAQQFPYEVQSYINGKDHFVKEIEVKAMNWYQTTKHN